MKRLKALLISILVFTVLTLAAFPASAAEKATRAVIAFDTAAVEFEPLKKLKLAFTVGKGAEPYIETEVGIEGDQPVISRFWHSADGKTLYCRTDLTGGQVYKLDAASCGTLLSKLFKACGLERLSDSSTIMPLLGKIINGSGSVSPDLLKLFDKEDRNGLSVDVIIDVGQKLLEEKKNRVTVTDASGSADVDMSKFVSEEFGDVRFSGKLVKRSELQLDSDDVEKIAGAMSEAFVNMLGESGKSVKESLLRRFNSTETKEYTLNVWMLPDGKVAGVSLKAYDETDGSFDDFSIGRLDDAAGKHELHWLMLSRVPAADGQEGKWPGKSINFVSVKDKQAAGDGLHARIDTAIDGSAKTEIRYRRHIEQTGGLLTGFRYVSRDKDGLASSGEMRLMYNADKGFMLSIFRNEEKICTLSAAFEETEADANPDTSDAVDYAE